MKKILLLLLISFGSLGQYKIETIDLSKSPYNLNKDFKITSWNLDQNGNLVFIVRDSKTVMDRFNYNKYQPRHYSILKKNGSTYSSYYFPINLEANGIFSWADSYPQFLNIDASGNSFIRGTGPNYLIFTKENNWKHFFRLGNKDNTISNFKKEYPNENITPLSSSSYASKNSFDGEKYVTASIDYDSISINTQTSFCCLNIPNDESLVYSTINGQKLFLDFFKGNSLKFEVGSGFSNILNLNIFTQPISLLRTSNNKIFGIFESSFEGRILCEIDFDTKKTKIHKLPNQPENPRLVAGKGNTVWIISRNIPSHISFFDGSKVVFFEKLFTGDRNIIESREIDTDGNLYYLDNTFKKVTPNGIQTTIDLQKNDGSSNFKIDKTNSIIWMETPNPQIFLKITPINSTNLTPNFSLTPISPKESETITFKDESTGSPTSWAWDFGDGTSSSIQNPTKKYSKAGTYKVKLTVSKAGATPQSITKDITILSETTPPPVERSIKIISPVSGSKVSALEPLNIKLELSSSTILASCKVEIKNLTGSLVKSLGNINGALINNFPFSIKDVSTGDYWLKVSGLSQPNLKDSVKIQVQNIKFKPGVTLVTHGFQPLGDSDLEDWTVRKDKNKGQISFCEAIKKRVELEGGSASIYENDRQNPGRWILKDGKGNDSDEIILFFNWAEISNNKADGALESGADYLFSLLVTPQNTPLTSNLLNSDIPFHFIAHSRGNPLLIQLLHRILKYYPDRKINQFTGLDPHPAKPMNDLNDENQNLSLPGVFGSSKNYPTNQPYLRLPENVLKCDYYYRQAFLYESLVPNLDFFDFSGIKIIGGNERQLIDKDLQNGATPIVGLKFAHTAVPEWYIGTILPQESGFINEGRQNWYILSRERFGYNQSRVGGRLNELSPIFESLNIEQLESRIIQRTGSKSTPLFNSEFNYTTSEWAALNPFDGEIIGTYYGYRVFGGVSPDRLFVKKGRLELNNSRYKGGSQSQFVKHNYMFFPPKSNYLVIDVSSFKDRTFLAVEFYSLNSNSEPIETKAFMLNRTGVYFVKIPEQLIGNTGTFRVKLSGTDKEHAVTIESITISEAEIVAKSPINFNWRNNEVNSSNPIGVVADGTNKILINVELEGLELKLKSHKAEIKISDVDNKVISSQYLGSMMPVITTSQKSQPLSLLHNSQISAINDTKLDGEFIFEYQAPIDFSRPLDIIDDSQTAIREILVSINLYDIGQNLIQTYSKKLRIVRPPLMLAHGLGGKGVGFEKGEDESTWRNFRYTNRLGGTDFFRYSNLFQVKRDINLLPIASFDENSDVLLGKSSEPNMEEESFDAMIKRMNDLGYACAKVDYVAHSMGGSVLRNTLEKAEYKNPKNYNQGYVNKFITICTPHQGSPLGDIVKEFTPYINFTPSVDRVQLKGINLIVKYWDFKDEYVYASEAIKDLALYSGKKFISSQVYNHQIIGSLIKNQNSTKDALISIIDENIKEVPGFFELTETLIKAAKVKFSVCACINELEEIKSIDKILNKAEKTISFFNWINSRLYSNSPEFMKNSDFVVSVESQSNGKIKEFPSDYKNLDSSNSVTFIDDVTHNFNPKATQSITIGNRVLDLLNSSVTSSKFDISIEKTSKIQTYPNCLADCNLFNQANNFDFTFSPNPAQNDFKLDLTEMGEAKEYQIKIFDEKGNLMHTQSVNNDCCPTISPSIKQPGIYSINITSEKGIKTKKIIINK